MSLAPWSNNLLGQTDGVGNMQGKPVIPPSNVLDQDKKGKEREKQEKKCTCPYNSYTFSAGEIEMCIEEGTSAVWVSSSCSIMVLRLIPGIEIGYNIDLSGSPWV